LTTPASPSSQLLVGVARQYSGTLGKKGNCQVTVNCNYAERILAWPVATRLYLPRSWAEDPTRRRRAHAPPDVTSQTKPQIVLDLLDRARACGVRWACVTSDADFGDNPNFLDGLGRRRQRCVVAARADFTVAAHRTGRATQRADALIEAQRRGRGVG
jgi:SRSO17 transposase